MTETHEIKDKRHTTRPRIPTTDRNNSDLLVFILSMLILFTLICNSPIILIMFFRLKTVFIRLLFILLMKLSKLIFMVRFIKILR